MKVSLERNSLLKAVTQVHAVAERRNAVPILANILINVTQEGLSFRATDLDVEMIVTISKEITVERIGAATVNAFTLYEIVRKLPDGAEVLMNYDEVSGHMSVKAGRSYFELSTLPREDFPIMATSEYDVNFSINSKTLLRLFNKTKFAMATEETRYYLTGVYMHIGTNEAGQCLRCVSTDGHRLAQIDTNLPDEAEKMPGVIVPRKTVGELCKMLEIDASLDISVSEAKVRFAVDGVILTSKVIDGTFPDYTRVIPVHNSRRMEVDAVEFLNAVDRVAVISSERSRGVKMNLETDNLILSVKAPESGHATEEVAVRYQNETLETGFNVKYLHDVISQVEGDDATFLFENTGDPVLVREGEDQSALYVIMPMRV